MAASFAESLIAMEIDARFGRDSHERIGGRPRRWTWETRMGTIRVAIPRLRNNSYSPDWLQRPGHHAERAVVALAVIACIRDVPPRRVRAALRALGIEQVTELQASDLARKLSAMGAAFRKRPLADTLYPYLALAARTHAYRPGRIQHRTAAVATAVRPDGQREVVGVDVADSDEDDALANLLASLVGRGLSGVRLVVAEDQPRLQSAIAELLPDAVWQLSPAQLQGDVSTAVPETAESAVASLVDTIYDQPDRAAVEAKHASVLAQLREAFPEAASRLAAARPNMLAFAGSPRAHWSLIWSNIPFERVSVRHAAAALQERPTLVVVAPQTPPVPAQWQQPPAPAPPTPAVRRHPLVGVLAARPRPAVLANLEPRLKNVASVAVILAAAVCIAVALPGAWLLLGTIAIGLCAAGLSGVNRQQLPTILLGVTVAAATVDYLTWRAGVANWSGWVIAAPLLVAEIFGAMHTLGLQYTVFPSQRRQLARTEDPSRRRIFILIPTVNEGPSVLIPTIKAALEARSRYLDAFHAGRATIVVCNDGRVAGIENWREVENLARRLGVTCITRTVGGGNKAGNLEHARQALNATGDALVAIFDADQIARPDFLIKTVPPFADPAVGWVQTGQYYRNLDQPVARWANDQQALFYRVLCPGKEAHNAAFICGTNVVVRAAALDEIGGLPQDSVTEDFAASIQLHTRWRSVFLTDVLAEGLGPMDMPAYLRQQRRWAIGTIGVLRTHWRAIFLPQRNGLRLEQRIQYWLACTHYLCGVRDLIYVIAPIAFLITGIPAVQTATIGQFLWHFVPYWAASQAAFWYAGRGVTGPRGVIIGFSSFPVLLQAVLTVVLGRRASFMLTSKRRREGRSWRHLAVYMVAVLCCCAAIGLALGNPHLRRESLAISVLWVVYDVSLLFGALWLGVMDLRVKAVPAGVRPAATVTRMKSTTAAHRESRRRRLLPSPEAMPNWAWLGGARRMYENPGAITLAGLLSLTLLFRISFPATHDPVVLPVNREPGQPIYLGLSVPYQLLGTRPETLQNQLCLPFTIVGRTQDISDNFDLEWADGLAARGQRPWVTLQFGNFTADGKPPLTASLPAIENGVHDADLQRWAEEIHSYAGPVYLTILLHVDRNWAVSSAVANGGIPQDAPRAWEHVQSIFKGAGDTNVAWVWAPADPSQDQAYAPPDSTIDVVLQSMIRYPGTPWPNSTAVLTAVSQRHPSKPLFVEVSAAGPPGEKAPWLQAVAATVAADPSVYALMYHEGSPDVNATEAEDFKWSVESDPSTLQAMLSWQSLVPTSTLPCQAPLQAARPGA